MIKIARKNIEAVRKEQRMRHNKETLQVKQKVQSWKARQTKIKARETKMKEERAKANTQARAEGEIDKAKRLAEQINQLKLEEQKLLAEISEMSPSASKPKSSSRTTPSRGISEVASPSRRTKYAFKMPVYRKPSSPSLSGRRHHDPKRDEGKGQSNKALIDGELLKGAFSFGFLDDDDIR
eukprot:CAMPEP_0170189272 /NCGR_PEP_ID=MMETSP0040_2-20121228/46422_1 /TAXON_ID=641309 /ORGANISM="Lotharella oceanica, Strain CCMP622" /LENGTH=180 /DNA_ID=CAMNT_0010436795 /DNA_START=135 /DNA_END=677 /DNA_ORIENTATION=-